MQVLNLNAATDAAAVREVANAVRAALGPTLVDLSLFESKARSHDDPGFGH